MFQSETDAALVEGRVPSQTEREMLASFQSEDFREGVAHYVEKRPARFTGR